MTAEWRSREERKSSRNDKQDCKKQLADDLFKIQHGRQGAKNFYFVSE